MQNKISIIGLGYVGLPLACSIAKTKKYQMVGLDLDEEKIDQINKGISPIDDEETKKLLPKVKLEVSTNDKIIKDSEFVIICVPTPVKHDKHPDLRPLISASRTAAKYLQKGQTIIVESTIYPGVCEEVVLPILEETGLKGGKDFELSHCPERISPGDPTWNVDNIPRNIGSLTKKGNKKAADFYRSFLSAPITELSCLKSAEATKVIENTFRDINIAYVNELAKSFDAMGIDIVEVIQGASNKPFAFMPHYPSCGVGGHCIPVDPYYLIERAKKAGFDHSFLIKAREINNSMPLYTIELLTEKLNEIKKSIKGTKIALLGLAYKANISDLRESPSLELIKILEKKGADLIKYDPYVPTLNNVASLEEALKKAEVILLATNHSEFKQISPKTLKNNGIKIVIDGKNCLNREAIISAGILYKGIGH